LIIDFKYLRINYYFRFFVVVKSLRTILLFIRNTYKKFDIVVAGNFLNYFKV